MTRSSFPTAKTVAASLLAGLMTSAAPLAYAQDAEAQVDGDQVEDATPDGEAEVEVADGGSGFVTERMVVTTQKREESILEVPLAITAVTGEFLRNTNITDVDELADLVAGVQIQLQGIETPSYVIRGISSDVSEPDAEPNVSIFFDGIPGSRGPGSVIDLFDLERVEIAKGPQGTLFSRGASNGAINFIMKKPTDEFEGYVRLERGNFENERYEGVVNVPIVEDTLLVRLGAAFHQREGFEDNPVADESFFYGKDSLHLRGSVTFRPTDRFETTVLGYWQYDSPDPTGFKTMVPALAEADPFLESTDPFGTYASTPESFVNREVYGVTALTDWGLTDSVTVSSTTGFREFQQQGLFDPDGTSLFIFDGGEDDDGRTYFHESRVSYEGEGRWSGFAGASYYKEEASRSRFFDINQDAIFQQVFPILLGQPLGLPIAGLPAVQEDSTLDAETTSFSVFADVTVDLTSTVSLTAGARWTRDKKENGFRVDPTQTPVAPGVSVPGSLLPLVLADINELFAFGAGDLTALGRFVDSLPTNPFSPGNPALLAAGRDAFGVDLLDPNSPLLGLLTPEQQANLQIIETNVLEGTTGGQRLTGEDTFSYFEPRFIAEWQFKEDWLAYASYSWGIRSGAVEIEPRAGTAPADFTRTVDPERVTSYEIGVKGAFDWDHTYLQLEGAAFYYDYEDFQTLIVQGGSLQNVNAGEADAVGFEAAANVAFDFGLEAFANVGFIDASIGDGATAAVLGPPVDLSGNRFRLTPRWTLSGGVTYERPLLAELSGYVSLLANYRSSQFFNIENEPATAAVPVPLAEDGYTLVTFIGGLKLTENYELQAKVENLFNEEYLIDAGNTGRTIGIPTAIRGQPRLFTLAIRVSF